MPDNDPFWMRELRAYCRGLRAGQHDARAALIMLEAVRIETLCDAALERLGIVPGTITGRRSGPWERRLVEAWRVRRLLVLALRRRAENP